MPVVYGINPVKEALRKDGFVKKIYIYKGRTDKEIERIINIAKAQNIMVSFVDKDFFRHFPKANQGIMAEIKQKLPCTLDDLYSITQKRLEPAFYFIIDSIEDPHNLGAILRVIEASGAHGVVMPKRHIARGPTVSKAAAGADIHLCIVKVPNIKHAIMDFQNRGITVIALEASGEKSLWQIDLKGPIACVVGSEGKGIKKTVLDLCNVVVKIPLFGEVASLNVSTATAIFAFELRRQRLLK